MHKHSGCNRGTRTFTAAAFALLVAASIAGGTLARAQNAVQGGFAVLAPSSLPALEEVFWRCDHASATRSVDMSEGAECGAATQALKDLRFGGDFAAMLEWWKANKREAHGRLDKERSTEDGVRT